MKRGKDNSLSEKSGPPGYVPLTLHQLGIGLTYYDEQRPAPHRNRHDSRRQDGNRNYEGNGPGPNGNHAGPGEPDQEPLDGADEGLSQEAALDQMHASSSGRNSGHSSGNGRRHHHGGGGGGPRRGRHNNGHGGGRRSGSHGGPMRGGIASGGRHRRGDDEGGVDGNTADAPRNEPRAVESRAADARGSDWSGGGDAEE